MAKKLATVVGLVILWGFLGAGTQAEARWWCERVETPSYTCAFCYHTVILDGQSCHLWEGWCSDGWHDTGWYCW